MRPRSKTPDALRYPADVPPHRWRSFIAAWIGWFSVGLSASLYVLVARPFLNLLLPPGTGLEARVGLYGSLIQGSFLVGWTLGGIVFGVLGDRLGRVRVLALTIVFFSLCNGLSALSGTWRQLLVLRFLAGLGVGGEWAAGSALVAETWPVESRAWVSGWLNASYLVGRSLASAILLVLPDSPRLVFLAGVLPVIAVFWIHRSVPEPAEWVGASAKTPRVKPGLRDLFRGPPLRVTVTTSSFCALLTTVVWSYAFWLPQILIALPDVASWDAAAKGRFVGWATLVTTSALVVGSLAAPTLVRSLGYRRAIALLLACTLASHVAAFAVPHGRGGFLFWISLCYISYSGVYATLPGYLPPLYPTLLRTTGAGFCYNIGRLVAAVCTIAFGVFVREGDRGTILLGVGLLLVPGILVAMSLPFHPDDAKA